MTLNARAVTGKAWHRPGVIGSVRPVSLPSRTWLFSVSERRSEACWTVVISAGCMRCFEMAVVKKAQALTAKKIKELAAGQVVEVVSDDEGIKKDMPAWWVRYSTDQFAPKGISVEWWWRCASAPA